MEGAHDLVGLDPSRTILVRVSRPIDALWAMEEALRAGLAVVGEIAGRPRALDFTATKRLEWRAREAGVTCWLVRVDAHGGADGSSAARCRWRVFSHPSAPDPHDPRAPGRPRWRLELTRARDRPPGAWVVEATHGGLGAAPDDGAADATHRTTHRLRVVAELASGGVATNERADGSGSGPGAVVPLRAGRGA